LQVSDFTKKLDISLPLPLEREAGNIIVFRVNPNVHLFTTLRYIKKC
jgi:hypothetical protein